MLSKEVSSTIFKVFAMTRPGIEPGSLANALPTGSMNLIIDVACWNNAGFDLSGLIEVLLLQLFNSVAMLVGFC